ncbi:hypothetical protein DFH07DRAFT_964721 [Mycena maculata]|uniref:RRM domain-containing protein n=1 Tax=Mycena maculata TaxID=230809 RepID=A0AAD7N1T5_9AGAR|nr:hypothetical protein DFH07DRAFT_964721 [Mycena maculata]
MTHTPSLSGPIFKFSRETNAVRVENIPQNVNRLEVLSLFSTLIGDIRASQDSDEALEITFFTADSARKALCMTGYSVAGSSLLVSPIIRTASPIPSHDNQQGRRTDMRRNLYVLGVPFGMTKYAILFLKIAPAYALQSLAALFAPHGTVAHCVILATLDGASRRRGFVVMSTHEEARQAMAALGRSGKGVGGMDVSWAVVQRSKGFLDGGDRAGVVHSPTSLNCPSPTLGDQLSNDSQALPSLSSTPTNTLLLANLPSLLFGSEDDLRGLVCPFGTVKALRIVTLPSPSSAASSPFFPISTSTPAPSTPITAAVVQYNALPAAQDARHALDGESYAGCRVRVAYLVEPDAEAASAPESPLPETPSFLPQLTFPPSFSGLFPPSSRCGPAVQKAVFAGRDVGNQLQGGPGVHYGHPGRQWHGPVHVQQQLYSSPPFPPFDSYPGYSANMLPGRWIPDSMYLRAPSARDMGYYV